jgi:hypothetical protein
VRPADLESWVGRPVLDLDKHPIFLTMPAVRTFASDGTEIRNYVNRLSAASCSGGGAMFAGSVEYAAYSRFSACMQRVPTCNNIFYIKDGIVTQYTPVGTGGARCYTDETARPGYAGPANIR